MSQEWFFVSVFRTTPVESDLSLDHPSSVVRLPLVQAGDIRLHLKFDDPLPLDAIQSMVVVARMMETKLAQAC